MRNNHILSRFCVLYYSFSKLSLMSFRNQPKKIILAKLKNIFKTV